MHARDSSPVTPRRAPASATRPSLPTIQASPDQNSREFFASPNVSSSVPPSVRSFISSDPPTGEQLSPPVEDYISRWSTDTNSPTADTLDVSLRSGLGGFAAALAKRRSRSNHKAELKDVVGGVKRESADSANQKKSAFNSHHRIPRPPSQLSLSRSSQHSSGIRKSQIGEPVLMQGDEQALLSE